MGNESAPGCLIHKDNRNVQVRLDYILLYQSEPKAKIIRILETWTDHKYAEWYKATADAKEQGADPPTEDLWVTLSYDQLTIFVYGTAQHDTVKQYVDELVASGDIQRRPHPEIPYGPPQYLLNRKKIQDSLDALEIPPNLFDLSPLFISPRKKHTPQEKYPQGRGINTPRVGVNLPPARGENTHPSNKHTKKILELPKKEEREGISADASMPLAFSAHQPENDSHSHSATSKSGGYTNHLTLPSRSEPVPFVEQVKQATEQTLPPMEPAAPEIPPTAEGSSGSAREAAPGEPDPAVIDLLLHPERLRNVTQERTQEKPKRGRRTPQEVHLTPHEQEIKEWYEELRGVSVSFSKRNITALAALGKRAMSKDDFLNVTAVLDSDKWFEEHKVGVDLYWINFHWENKIVYLHRKQAPPQEENVYKSLDAMLAIKAGTRQQKVQGSHD